MHEAKRRRVLQIWGKACGACRKDLPYNAHSKKYVYEIDHFFPQCAVVDHTLSNIWPLCCECHAMKTQMESNGRQLWCNLCNTLYTQAHGHQECFLQRREEISRSLQKTYTPTKRDLPHPDDWVQLFSFKTHLNDA